MNIALTTNRPPLPLTIVRWAARLASLASIALLALFAFGPLERAWPTPGEWLLIAFFPIGVALGMAIAWWRELLGGAITLGSLTAFYAAALIASGSIPKGPYLVLIALPGLVLLVCGLVTRALTPRPRAAL